MCWSWYDFEEWFSVVGVNGEGGAADVGYVELSCVARCVCDVLWLLCGYWWYEGGGGIDRIAFGAGGLGR